MEGMIRMTIEHLEKAQGLLWGIKHTCEELHQCDSEAISTVLRQLTSGQEYLSTLVPRAGV